MHCSRPQSTQCACCTKGPWKHAWVFFTYHLWVYAISGAMLLCRDTEQCCAVQYRGVLRVTVQGHSCYPACGWADCLIRDQKGAFGKGAMAEIWRKLTFPRLGFQWTLTVLHLSFWTVFCLCIYLTTTENLCDVLCSESGLQFTLAQFGTPKWPCPASAPPPKGPVSPCGTREYPSAHI